MVDFCGPSDFLAFAESAPNESRSGGPVQKLLGGPLHEKKEVAKQASPVTFVSADDPPFLIVHGTDDRTVPINQAERLNEKLKADGVNVTFVKIIGGGHGIGGPAVDQRVRAFGPAFTGERSDRLLRADFAGGAGEEVEATCFQGRLERGWTGIGEF